ncbi:hypothetical protein [Nocardioides sp. L-11A]|uniref:hypothetical protein n=1 Tax=Nocardioides sp. L-11A TaxID=3043848 RepID=UPI00249A4939|nr:hypothetical protein QJ852_09925 [Nocardioides sp. L-11A]
MGSNSEARKRLAEVSAGPVLAAPAVELDLVPLVAIARAAAEDHVPMPARVDIDQAGTCDGCAESAHLVAAYPDGEDTDPWLCEACAVDADFQHAFGPTAVLVLLGEIQSLRVQRGELEASTVQVLAQQSQEESRLRAALDEYGDLAVRCARERDEQRRRAEAAEQERDEARAEVSRWEVHFGTAQEQRDDALARLAAAESALAAVRRALDDELANLADDGARLSHSVVRRIEAVLPAPTSPGGSAATTTKES